MSGGVYQLILPSEDCRRLHHRIETRNKQGSGVYEYCYVCSLGYQRAMDALDDESAANAFVQSLRRETSSYRGG